MGSHDKKEGMTLTLVEAVEALSSIADLQFDHEVGIAQQHDLVLQDKPVTYHTVHWLHRNDAEMTVNMVKEIFRVILKYLQNFYKNDYVRVSDPQALEGVKTIMVLVGEAAKKLDKYTTLFYKTRGQSITDLKEYKQLREFYLSRIAQKFDEGTISKWVLALARKGGISSKEEISLERQRPHLSKHVFMDLESVKKDTEYELFFLKKEDGSRFFSPRLVRNIKLVSDFGGYIEGIKDQDPLYGIEIWEDKVANRCAKEIVRSTKKSIEKFYREGMRFRDGEVVGLMNKSLIALLMAADSHHLTQLAQGLEMKSCRDYFCDFQFFLRSCLRSTEYQKLMAYPDRSNRVIKTTLDLVHLICMALYTQLSGYHELLGPVHELIQSAEKEVSKDHVIEAGKGNYKLWTKLAGDYAAMVKLVRGHGRGPLCKIIEALEEGECGQFDPLLQGNLPSQLFALYVQENRFQFAQWPSPICQEFIQKAKANEEFKAFLYGCSHEKRINKVLILNLQDRLSWKEHCRSFAVEDLPDHESFSKYIDVVTLAKDTEFYHQLAPYHQDNDAAAFLKNFQAQIADPEGGFFFSKSLRKELLAEFIPGALEAVHRIFFSQKNVLLREHRLNFIEIFYLFLELKILELLKPDEIGFSCKDGLDVSLAAGAGLFAFLKLANQERLSENDQEHLDLMLYGPCLIARERVMIPDRFNRMVNTLKWIESVREQFGQASFAKIIQEAFGFLYKTPILKGKAVVQSNKDIF